ncbi:MAG: hypothetical protein ACOYMD_16290 [Paludibacter sp.]
MKRKSYLILFVILYGIVLLISIVNKIDSRKSLSKSDKDLEPGVQLEWDINRPKISSGINIFNSNLRIPNSKDLVNKTDANLEKSKTETLLNYKTIDNKVKKITFLESSESTKSLIPVYIVSKRNYKNANQKTGLQMDFVDLSQFNGITILKNKNKSEVNTDINLTLLDNSPFETNLLIPLKDASKNITQDTHGFYALASDLSTFEMGIADGGPQNVDIDPGGGDEMGNPIPIPDGFWFLMFLAFSFGIWKKLKLY